jgi:Arc/MetJ-type ribon-helix-helix transcriptional regulator
MAGETERIHLSLPIGVVRWAERRAKAEHYTNLSAYVAELLRREIRRSGTESWGPTADALSEDRSATNSAEGYDEISSEKKADSASSPSAGKAAGRIIRRTKPPGSKPTDES